MADSMRIERPSNDTMTAKVITALDEGLVKRLLKEDNRVVDVLSGA